LSDTEWNQYLARREARRTPVAGVPEFIAVNGTSKELSSSIQEKLEPFAGKPVDTTKLENNLMEFMGLGRFSSMDYSLIRRDGKTGMLITAEEKDYSPP